MQNITFSALLTQILSASGLNLREAQQFLSENGADVPYSSLAAYKTFTAVPAYDRGKEILDAFHYVMDDDELIEILQYSRSELKEYKEDERQYVNKGIRLSAKYFKEGITTDELESLVETRIQELNEKNWNTYIASLIRKDLIEDGLITEN